MSNIKFNKSSALSNKLNRKFYCCWKSMQYRCSKKSKGYVKERYIDRGILVCERWQDFNYFFIDMLDSYLLHYNMNNGDTELDRKNNNKGYNRSNCDWVTRKENTNNRENRSEFNGKTLTEWSEILKIKRSTLSQRIHAYGWSIDRALSKK